MIRESSTNTISEIRWRCRRGMLELDFLLNTFLDNGFIDLDHDQRELFTTMLEYPDQVLFDLLMENMKSSDQNIAELVNKIRIAVNHL